MNAAVLTPLLVGVLLSTVAAPSSGLAQKKPTVLLSEADDERVGREASKSVEAQLGVLDDPELNAYVEGIGKKLLRAVVPRSFAYRFRVVDQTEPNAFALPGGYVFVSRGLLGLANSEDELACVLGHEISHVAKRHAAAQQAAARGQMPLLWPGLLSGRMAAYSRDLERTADRDGQILCAAAGYDPHAMANFLESLQRSERLQRGYTRNASFFDTHPGSGKRATIARVQASELRWKRDPALGDPREALLRKIEGLPVGQSPEAGLFLGDVFLHPDLDFKLRFPRRWKKANAPQMVGAQAPRRDALVVLTADVPSGEPQRVAETWARSEAQEHGQINESRPFAVGLVQAWQLGFSQSQGGAYVRSYVTFIPHRGATYRITGAGISEKELKRALATTRSFRALTPEDRAAVFATRLRLAEARPDEDVAALVKRTGSVWDTFTTTVYNGLSPSHRFRGGELVKIAKKEPYRPKRPKRKARSSTAP